MSSGGHGGHGGGGLPGLEWINHILHNAHENAGSHAQSKTFVILFIAFIGAFFFVDPLQTIYNFEFLIFFAPIWIPLVLIEPTKSRFVDAKRYETFSKRTWVLLELRMPRDTAKTPFAMETFINNLHIGSGESNWFKKYINGNMRPSWSFEIVSIEGRVHFYIWTTDGYRRLVEAYLYAQYPDVEIIEVEDYARLIDPAGPDWSMWGGEFEKKAKSPVPIKTYMDYGLTPGAKPEENVDPLAQIIEFLGSLGPGEQLWIQMIIRMTKTEKYEPQLNSAGKPFTWRDEAAQMVEEMRQKFNMKAQHVDPATGITDEQNLGNLTEGQKNSISAIERNVAKPGFDVGIRAIYCAKKDKFQGINIGSMISMFRPFNSESNNSLGLQGRWGGIFGDYPWEDPNGHHKHHLDRELTDVYRRRVFFNFPYFGSWSILSSEELATIFHIPSRGVNSPALARTQSATSAPPSNLPT